jgi:hypothetical protein
MYAGMRILKCGSGLNFYWLPVPTRHCSFPPETIPLSALSAPQPVHFVIAIVPRGFHEVTKEWTAIEVILETQVMEQSKTHFKIRLWPLWEHSAEFSEPECHLGVRVVWITYRWSWCEVYSTGLSSVPNWICAPRNSSPFCLLVWPYMTRYWFYRTSTGIIN